MRPGWLCLAWHSPRWTRPALTPARRRKPVLRSRQPRPQGPESGKSSLFISAQHFDHVTAMCRTFLAFPGTLRQFLVVGMPGTGGFAHLTQLRAGIAEDLGN